MKLLRVSSVCTLSFTCWSNTIQFIPPRAQARSFIKCLKRALGLPQGFLPVCGKPRKGASKKASWWDAWHTWKDSLRCRRATSSSSWDDWHLPPLQGSWVQLAEKAYFSQLFLILYSLGHVLYFMTTRQGSKHGWTNINSLDFCVSCFFTTTCLLCPTITREKDCMKYETVSRLWRRKFTATSQMVANHFTTKGHSLKITSSANFFDGILRVLNRKPSSPLFKLEILSISITKRTGDKKQPWWAASQCVFPTHTGNKFSFVRTAPALGTLGPGKQPHTHRSSSIFLRRHGDEPSPDPQNTCGPTSLRSSLPFHNKNHWSSSGLHALFHNQQKRSNLNWKWT